MPTAGSLGKVWFLFSSQKSVWIPGVLESRGRVEIIAAAVAVSCLIRKRPVCQGLLCHRIQPIRGNHVIGKRLALESAAPSRHSRRRIIDLVLRAQRQQRREIALAHRLGGHGADERLRHAEFVRAVSVEPERAILAIVNPGEPHRAAGYQAPTVIGVVRNPLTGAVLKDVRRVEHGIAQRPLRLAVKLIGSALGADIDYRPNAVSGACIKSGGLNLELGNGR